MGAGRTFAGILFCLIVIVIINVFLTLGLSVSDLTAIGFDTSLFQAIFLIDIHPYTFITGDGWSILAALGGGAFVGGLISKGAKNGVLVGTITFALLWILQIGIALLFDFNALYFWYALLELVGGSIILDFAISAGILIVAGAIGGAITGGGE